MLSFITEQNTKANGAGSSQQMMDPGKRETGARPVRTRHCKREVYRKHPHTEEATGVCKETGKVLQYMMIREPGNLPYAVRRDPRSGRMPYCTASRSDEVGTKSASVLK